MLHDLLHRLAQYGGEGALGALFLLSVVSVGMIGQRIWLFLQRWSNTNAFVKELSPLLRVADLRRAESLCQQTNSSVRCVALAGLLESTNGLSAVRHALEAAICRERTALEDTFLVLNELGRLALLIGVVGSLFDLLAVGHVISVAAVPDASPQVAFLSALLPALAPTIGGMLVAIPAWLARSMLTAHVQRIVRECEFVARLVLSHLATGEQTAPGPTIPLMKTRRVAA